MYEDFLDLHGYTPPEVLDTEMAAIFEAEQRALVTTRNREGGAFFGGVIHHDAALAEIIRQQGRSGTFLTEAEQACDFQCDACPVPAGERGGCQ